VRQQIEKRNHVYATKANKGHKHVIFQPGDWFWVHSRKERFPTHRKSKLQPRGNGLFQIFVSASHIPFSNKYLYAIGMRVCMNTRQLWLFIPYKLHSFKFINLVMFEAYQLGNCILLKSFINQKLRLFV
jgi:hypothetical protein